MVSKTRLNESLLRVTSTSLCDYRPGELRKGYRKSTLSRIRLTVLAGRVDIMTPCGLTDLQLGGHWKDSRNVNEHFGFIRWRIVLRYFAFTDPTFLLNPSSDKRRKTWYFKLMILPKILTKQVDRVKYWPFSYKGGMKKKKTELNHDLRGRSSRITTYV